MRSFRRFHGIRRVRTTAEIRAVRTVQAVDEPPFRSKRDNLPTLWDDVKRTWQRSWKVQTKARKQWEKALIGPRRYEGPHRNVFF